ncbi:TM2 domain-containing protein [Mucilaginibacter myungsuensis]|uniref:TM2 domain-containing protein n=1 Tax=Mucilaginibacter myungsuensis TaxID=649104 RepID=A0A929KT72_9SPHI|nr:TM2 domain-containing protein [Mucilaginibacter myungsuensis]MBE9661104.1 TM2 domain-containing protein [Mucilaginibacter myungsuensis]MDN3597248.1 TM2 domain-containing protein [Mucilaginibacter myungsuensis]
MDMQPNAYMMLPGITPEEMALLQQATAGLTEDQKRNFFNIYAGKRKSPQDILLFTLLGFIVVAGVQRFVMGQIGMGILYLLTGGFCLIGTIVDLVNHKDLAFDYNKKMAYESFQIIKGGGAFY